VRLKAEPGLPASMIGNQSLKARAQANIVDLLQSQLPQGPTKPLHDIARGNRQGMSFGKQRRALFRGCDLDRSRRCAHRSEALGKLVVEHPCEIAPLLRRALPLSLDQVRLLLGDEEALVLFTFTESDLFIWTVSRNGESWRKTQFSAADIAREVQALRCGLDTSAWSSRVSACSALLGRTYTEEDAQAGQPLPFDIARAHALYIRPGTLVS